MVDELDQGAPDECVQRAVTAMLADRNALADDIASYLIGRIAEIRDLHVEDLVRASCRANMRAILDNLARQVPSSAIAVSTEVLDYTHAMVRRELSLDAGCWLERRAETSVEPVLSQHLSQHGVVVGVGRPGVGPEGFRRSHREAVAALRVAQIASGHVPTVLNYDDVSVAALCTADEAFARRFVHDELGPLLGEDHTSRMQRETLAAFYAANSNYRATAAALGVHHNTVRYRLEQIEHRLGRLVSDRRLALEVAVHLAEVIGSRTQTQIATRE